jgi:hypothetical protein
MKRFLMLVAVAAVAGAMYVAAAPGSQQAAPPTAAQFAALKKQVASLNKSLKALKKDEKQAKTAAVDAAGFISSCFVNVVPVSEFGDPNGTFGFQFVASPGATATSRTALDADGSATPQGFLQAVDSSCVTSGSSAGSAAAHALRPGGQLPLRAERTR